MCWFPSATDVVVETGRELVAHVSGITRCGSPWACPVCAPAGRERRARDIDQGIAEALDRGYGVTFLTQTVRHHRADELAPRLDVISQALRWTLKGEPWERRKAALDYAGAIKAVEVTHGVNGWHPHSHSLLVTRRPLDRDDLADLEEWIYGRWSAVVERRGFGSITRAHGVDVRPVTTSDDLGGYLTKVEGGWGAGLELARADLKRPKGKGRTPLSFLAEFVETGELAPLRRWREYETATAGRRAIVWSPGLRAELLPGVEELTDVEAAAAEGADVSLFRALVPAPRWVQLVKAGGAGDLLSEVERMTAVLLAVADALGHEVRPLDVGREVDRESA